MYECMSTANVADIQHTLYITYVFYHVPLGNTNAANVIVYSSSQYYCSKIIYTFYLKIKRNLLNLYKVKKIVSK